MHDINSTIVGLQKQILILDAAAEPDRKHAAAIIKKALDLSQKLLSVPKNNRNLEIFFLSIAQTLHELLLAVQNEEIDEATLAAFRKAIQTLAVTYQESVVPMLTRLHNLSTNEDDMQTITTITSLGNEVITCTSQVYHFSDQLAPLECIFSIAGLALMLEGIALTIALLSRPGVKHPLLQALSIIALGCNLCSHAVAQHRADPGADLVVASINKIMPLIPEIAKQNHSDQARLASILKGEAIDKFVEPVEVVKLVEVIEVESKPETATKHKAAKKQPAKKPHSKAVVAKHVEQPQEEILATELEPTTTKHHKAHKNDSPKKGPGKLMQRFKKFVNSLNEKRN